MQAIIDRLDRIESVLEVLAQQRTIKDFYSTDEIATVLGKAEFTVREWARNGRIKAQKRRSGRGKYRSWVISHEELQRIQKEGLLPKN
jgi:transposase